MRTIRPARLILCAALAITLAGCRRNAEQTAVNSTPAPGVPEAPAPTAAPPPAAESSSVTADPIVASQRNAKRRRPAGETHVASGARTKEGGTGYSEERRGTASREHEVPAGTILRVAFDKTISTATARTGDTVSGELLDDVLAEDGVVVAPSGSRVTARIENVVDSGKLARPAQLSFRLIELARAGGRSVPITTSVYQRTGESHAKRNTEYIAGGAAVGALLGQLIGRDTKSTLEGAAAGAAAGTGVAATTGDLDFEIQAGRTVAFTLEQPLRLPVARS